MDISDRTRLSVTLVDVAEGKDSEFLALAAEIEAMLVRKKFGNLEVIRDEGRPLRFYVVRRWTDAAAANAFHVDTEVQGLTARLYQMARVTHVVNGVRPPDALRLLGGDRRTRGDADRRMGFDRRVKNIGRPEGDRRKSGERRLGPRRIEHRPEPDKEAVDLLVAARRAREHAEADYSHFKVGAALETTDGAVFTGCNIENATLGLTICAERVAMFKARSEGHRAFRRIVIVADTREPTPPCGACRQILWEFGGNLEVQLANLSGPTGTHQLKDLLPLPFDARLL